jgi:hypothetical protein
VQAEWLKHRALGVYHVTKNLLAIQSLFQPLRRIASGGLLAPREIKVGTVVLEHALPAGYCNIPPACLDDMHQLVCSPTVSALHAARVIWQAFAIGDVARAPAVPGPTCRCR